ncbi:YkgJ family cysteine cluster protein [Candidatus Woesearchaeota archaeon]|nr:YkgJ family cysteine cluster protein [Candidatus Woesearchaeota archaeon]
MELQQIKQMIKKDSSVIIEKDTPLDIVENYGKECNQCGKCCSIDSGLVLEEDIPKIADFFRISAEQVKQLYLDEHQKFNTSLHKLKQVKKEGKPYGRGILFNEKNKCAIHTVKPKHCRVCSVKSKYGEQLSIWFLLNHLVNADDAESIRQYAQYLQTHPTIPGGELEKLVPDKERLRKILNYEILR